MKRIIFIILPIAIYLSSCNTTNTNAVDDEAHVHEAMSYTLFSDSIELFVEFPALIAGEEASFLVHLTRLSTYKPISDVSVEVTFFESNENYALAEKPVRPGIYDVDITPENIGETHIRFHICGESFHHNFFIEHMMVLATKAEAEEHLHAADEHSHEGDVAPEDPDLHEDDHSIDDTTADTALVHGEDCEHDHEADDPQLLAGSADDITFLKESAWKIDFSVYKVEEVPFYNIIETTGEIIQARGDEMIITAKDDGIVIFRGNDLFPGVEINKGSSLFNISGKNFLDDNIHEEYLQLKAKFETSKLNFKRSKSLYKDRLITEKEFLGSKLTYESDSTSFMTFENSYKDGGTEVRAPIKGFIKEIFVTEGEYVSKGQTLCLLSKNNKLVLQAEVPQHYFAELKNIVSANIETPYDNKVYDLDDYNARLLSYSKTSNKSGLYVPVFFEFTNDAGFIPGTLVEVFLKLKPASISFAIPKSALMEEQGNYYVYVQSGGESFAKRDIILGWDNGKFVSVKEGLNSGERIVSVGANRIKMASMSGAIPSHGHVH